MNEFDYAKTDDYLMDRLNATERKAFEEKMQADAAFKAQVLKQQEAMAALEVLNDQQWKKKLQEIHQEVTQPAAPAPKERRLMPRWLAAAASIALLVFAGYWLLSEEHSSPDQLFAEHYQSYELNFGSRSGNTPAQLVEAGAAYQQKDFAKASQLFTALPDSLQSTTTQLAAGIAQIELKQYEQALSYFQRLIDQKDPVFTEQAQWYAAMAYLKLKQELPACQLLRELADQPKAFQATKAKEIVQKLC